MAAVVLISSSFFTVATGFEGAGETTTTTKVKTQIKWKIKDAVVKNDGRISNGIEILMGLVFRGRKGEIIKE